MKTECSSTQWEAENYYLVIISLDYSSISETIYTLFIKLASARSLEIEGGNNKEEYRRQSKKARKRTGSN